MQQMQIYEYIGADSDPLFNKISLLKRGQAMEFGEYQITLNNHGLYEVENEEIHECFTTKKELYDGISKILSLIY